MIGLVPVRARLLFRDVVACPRSWESRSRVAPRTEAKVDAVVRSADVPKTLASDEVDGDDDVVSSVAGADPSASAVSTEVGTVLTTASAAVVDVDASTTAVDVVVPASVVVVEGEPVVLVVDAVDVVVASVEAVVSAAVVVVDAALVLDVVGPAVLVVGAAVVLDVVGPAVLVVGAVVVLDVVGLAVLVVVGGAVVVVVGAVVVVVGGAVVVVVGAVVVVVGGAVVVVVGTVVVVVVTVVVVVVGVVSRSPNCLNGTVWAPALSLSAGVPSSERLYTLSSDAWRLPVGLEFGWQARRTSTRKTMTSPGSTSVTRTVAFRSEPDSKGGPSRLWFVNVAVDPPSWFCALSVPFGPSPPETTPSLMATPTTSLMAVPDRPVVSAVKE